MIVATLQGPASAGASSWPGPAGITERITVATDGTQANEESWSGQSMSYDGRYVTFISYASNLVAGDTNGTDDAFLLDRSSGALSRVSVAGSGAEANGYTASADISADGRFVTFDSAASNLVPDDTNGLEDVFVLDRTTGAVSRVNVSNTGAEADHVSRGVSISADGRYVAFASFASNLVAGDTFESGDIFVADRTAGTVSRVSVGIGGTQANGNSGVPVISADGRYVAFMSPASNLVPGDTNAKMDVFVVDTTNSAVARVSVSSAGVQGNGYSALGGISADGRYVAFTSESDNLVPDDTNHTFDVFVADRTDGSVSRIGAGSAEPNGPSRDPSISADGRYVAFSSHASNLVPGDTNDREDAFVLDRTSATIVRASLSSSGTQSVGGPGSSGALVGAISGDGNYVVFGSWASDLVPGDTGGLYDLFVRNVGVAPLVPFAPTAVIAVAGPGVAAVSWNGPANTGSSAITGYTVVASPGGASCTTGGATACTVTGLTHGTAYTFTVTATNAVGTSLPSAASAAVVPLAVPEAPVVVAPPLVVPPPSAPLVVLAKVPGKPMRVVAMRGHHAVVVTWAAPGTGGSPITSYRVVATPGGRACVSTTLLRCTVTGLVNGRSYRFTVAASNALGAGLPSAASLATAPAPVPGVASRVVAVRGNARATVSWARPAANGTAAISGYRVVASPGGRSCTTRGATRCTVVGLVNGRQYAFSVVAINRVGTSPHSIAAVAVPATVPVVVRRLAAAFPASLRTVATWSAPVSTGGLPLLRYEFRTSRDGGRTWSRYTSVGGARSATVSGWLKGRIYLIEVRAITAAGPGAGTRLAIRPTR